MQTFVKISLLALCLGLASAEMRSADIDLMQFMVRSRDLSQENPTRSMACFDYYVPVLNGITQEYESNYAACLQSSTDSRSGVDDSTYPERKEIDDSAQSSCKLMNSCSEHEDSISYFECYANAGSENTKSMYTISANSSEILAKIREEYRLIDNEEYRCTNASERVYVEGTSVAYEQLQSCLQGKTPVPTTTQAPITTSTTEGTTTGMPEEITTTAAPEEITTTTFAPVPEETTTPASEETTEAPEETTEAPEETTEAAPEETTTEAPEETTEAAPEETTEAAPEETTTEAPEETTTTAPEETTTEASEETTEATPEETTPEDSATVEDSSNGSGDGSESEDHSESESESSSSSVENRMPEEDVRATRRIKEALEKLRQQLRRN